MNRKTFFMAVTAVAVCLVADSAWACRFLDTACCRSRRVCVWTCPGVIPTDCCEPTTCGPATGSVKVEGTITITPSEQPKESPKTEVQPTPEVTPPVVPVEVPAKPEKPALPVESTPVERAVEPKPVAEPPKEPAPVAEPPKEPTPVAEPPKEPTPVAEPPKDLAPVAEPPKPAEPETDAFGNTVAEPPKKADEDIPAAPKVEEPKAEEPKVVEPEAAPPKKADEVIPAEPKAEPPKTETPAEPAKPAEPEKKEEADPFGKNDVKTYRLWTDASGEFKVNARFVGFVDGKVRLQKADGKYVRIEMNLLCMDDQRLLRQVETLAKNP